MNTTYSKEEKRIIEQEIRANQTFDAKRITSLVKVLHASFGWKRSFASVRSQIYIIASKIGVAVLTKTGTKHYKGRGTWPHYSEEDEEFLLQEIKDNKFFTFARAKELGQLLTPERTNVAIIAKCLRLSNGGIVCPEWNAYRRSFGRGSKSIPVKEKKPLPIKEDKAKEKTPPQCLNILEEAFGMIKKALASIDAEFARMQKKVQYADVKMKEIEKYKDLIEQMKKLSQM